MPMEVTEKKVYDLKIDPELEDVIPPLEDSELYRLTESILAEGCRDPLVVWDGVLIDGHHRYSICREHNIPFTYIEKQFESVLDAKLWIITNQLARRNLNVFVRCEMVLPLEAELKKAAKKRQGWRKGQGSVLAKEPKGGKPINTREELASIAGVSGTTIRKVKLIVLAADETTKEQIRKGELSVHSAYKKLTGKDSPEEKLSEEEEDLPEGDMDLSEDGKKEVSESDAEPVPGGLIPKQFTENQMKPTARYGCIVNLPPTAENVKDFFPDSLYDIPPVHTFGMAPVDDLDFRGKAEMTHAKSSLTREMENHVRRVGEILRPMTAASINDENIATLRGIITNGYNQTMDYLNLVSAVGFGDAIRTENSTKEYEKWRRGWIVP